MQNHAIIPPLNFFTGRKPFLLNNQQRQSTEAQKVINNMKMEKILLLLLNILGLVTD